MELTISPLGLTRFPGVGAPPRWTEDVTGAQLVRAVRLAEEAGIAHVVIPWHVAIERGHWEQNMGPRWPNPFVTSGVFLGATETINMIPLAVAPCSHPVDLAKALSTLSWLSGGRCSPALLAGYIRWEFELLGADFDQRDDVTDEWTEAVLSLWAGESSFDGRFVSYADVVFEPQPAAGSMPLWLGGGSRRSLDRIARWGDGWLASGIEHAKVPDAIEYICSQPAWRARSVPLKVSVPFIEPTFATYSHKLVRTPDHGIGREWAVERAEYLAQLGVDVSIAPLESCPTVGLPGRGQDPSLDTFEEYLRRIEWLGSEVVRDISHVDTTIAGSRRLP